MFAAEPATAEFWSPGPHPEDTSLDRLGETQSAPKRNPSPRPVDTHTGTRTSNSAHIPHEYPPPTREYGDQWLWDPDARDYVREKDGVKQFYTDYQKAGGSPPSPAKYRIVEKPKRFFCVGRIFKTVWFEPGPKDTPDRRADLEQWSSKCPGFRGQKPVTRFRWFVVVRRRLHHTLCFNITTFGGEGSAKSTRGRPQDYVVLHSSAVKPPRPYDEENITRDPIAVIIEDDEQYISPIARLDCGRIYTLEDGLPVLKIGRVHPASLSLLEQYAKESML
ncbi:hypothetical protein MMYC01_204024 [Madurella mycetomatis]|uniref:DUF6590 domain-containing protein n=1 Tax=Madurella mycetomatis TaxID=100816 RepID=A0A175W518_9PEZI|nr:hypothetical protein MMYC01_204024 [Madurella mycetomatis]